ncbi:MAG: proline dehydrogenase family protein [Vicinamibacterales bacterium]
MRNVLLAASTNPWLRERATKAAFVKRSVRRFMPGERIEDALGAARGLQRQGLGTILTALGENLTRREEAEEVTQHYLDVFDRVAAAGLDAHISVKPTQLGLDLDRAMCERNLDRLLDRADARNNFLWIDMEYSRYVDPTLELYRRARAKSTRIGIALQAYLRRTEKDVESLLTLGPAVRIVKGAYLEPPDVAYPAKADVDANFYRLCTRLLSPDAQKAGTLLHIATHDVALADRLIAHIAEHQVPASAYEFAMLYGIGVLQQKRLAAMGKRVRVLISYGEYWFPWYMRRLAERPANVWFVVKNVFG